MRRSSIQRSLSKVTLNFDNTILKPEPGCLLKVIYCNFTCGIALGLSKGFSPSQVCCKLRCQRDQVQSNEMTDYFIIFLPKLMIFLNISTTCFSHPQITKNGFSGDQLIIQKQRLYFLITNPCRDQLAGLIKSSYYIVPCPSTSLLHMQCYLLCILYTANICRLQIEKYLIKQFMSPKHPKYQTNSYANFSLNKLRSL